jgi:hypothetical protein
MNEGGTNVLRKQKKLKTKTQDGKNAEECQEVAKRGK